MNPSASMVFDAVKDWRCPNSVFQLQMLLVHFQKRQWKFVDPLVLLLSLNMSLEIPEDLLFEIFLHLDALSIGRCTQVCKSWKRVIHSKDEAIWKPLCLQLWNNSHSYAFSSSPPSSWRKEYQQIGTKIIVVGGVPNDSNSPTNEVECFDLVTETWTQMPPTNKGRQGTVCVMYEGAVHVVGKVPFLFSFLAFSFVFFLVYIHSVLLFLLCYLFCFLCYCSVSLPIF